MPRLQRAPTRIERTPVMDSRRWDGFSPRDGDIVIATYSKCGTTWTQRIVDLLVFQSPDVRRVDQMSPWLDATIFNPLEDDLATLAAQTHRRFIKSHLPFDALPVWDTVKYIHVGRDGRDARLSWQNHQQGFRPEFVARIAAQAMALAAQRGETLTGPPPALPEDPRGYLLAWLDELEAALDGPGGAAPAFFGFEATYWRERRRPNLLLTHYDDLKENLAGEMRRIADFLEIETPETLMLSLVEAARFETMKRDGDALLPRLMTAFDRGADRFLNQGRSGRWRDCLTPGDVGRYEAIARRAASPGLARWLEGGRRAAGEPTLSPD
jgi:aryl sulfotransferase